MIKGDDGMRSADPVAALVAMPERSWEECNHGKPLTQNGLARRLKPFGISTCDIHTGYGRHETKSLKGYAPKSFEDVFNRYLPPLPSAQPRTRNENNDLDKIKPRNGGMVARMEMKLTH